jgi:hypothetical protein
MTKKLADLFDLSDEKDIKQEDSEPAEVVVKKLEAALKDVDKVDAALPTVRDLETSDQELDEIAETAKNTFNDLMDLGMNVEARYSGDVFNNASRMLETALTAKTNKINKKLKMVELQIKKAQLDLKQREGGYDDSIDGDGIVIDRNALMREILGRKE